MEVKAKLNNLRIAPRKARVVADIIRDKDTEEALVILEETIKGASVHFKKLLESAIANAENNFGLSRDNLYIKEARVDEGVTLKRWRARAYGRAAMILKRTSKVSLTLDEKVEGKDRKTKEEMEKIRKERMEAKRKEAREQEKAQAEKDKEQGVQKTEKPKKEEKLEEKKQVEEAKEDRKLKKPRAGKKSGSWVNRVFRRKSM